ncbi:hypothetical protein CBER1_07466 [Cercospora berteroae]|uniref:Uncharacterized protein n=1 Tax=Cercospora berteroae TaxID=357750 RepID=A0A2S6BTH1_9PEZI|nr:hypothetical protein CBER1_07466 [Cercospora berteroae]
MADEVSPQRYSWLGTNGVNATPNSSPSVFWDAPSHSQDMTAMQSNTPIATYFDTSAAYVPPAYNPPSTAIQGNSYGSFGSSTLVGSNMQPHWNTGDHHLQQSASMFTQHMPGPEFRTPAFAPNVPNAPAAFGSTNAANLNIMIGHQDGDYASNAEAVNLGYPNGRDGQSSFRSSQPAHHSSPRDSLLKAAPRSAHWPPSTPVHHNMSQTIVQSTMPAGAYPTHSDGLQSSPASAARTVASKSKSRGAKNMSTIVTRMSCEEAKALIEAKKATFTSAEKQYVNQFSNRQDALDHLSRLTGALQFHRPHAHLRINTEDIDPRARLAISQYFLDAILEAPAQAEVPDYLTDDNEKQNFCMHFLLVQMVLDVYDHNKGVPLSDLDSRLHTCRGKHKLEIDITFHEKVALIGDILKRYKWVGKDVLNNSNICLIVVATEAYLRTKLNNCDSNAVRQVWKDEEMKKKGVTKRVAAKTKKPSDAPIPATTQFASLDESFTSAGTTVDA